MAEVSRTYKAPKGVRSGQAFNHDCERPTYLDGVESQYSAEVLEQRSKGMDQTRIVAYCFDMLDAQVIADAFNARPTHDA